MSSLIGRGLIVSRQLIKDLSVELGGGAGTRGTLVVAGSIMESAKVFESLKVETRGRQILLTVYASLAFWNKQGGPDFRATHELDLEPGDYEVLYLGEGEETDFVKNIKVGA